MRGLLPLVIYEGHELLPVQDLPVWGPRSIHSVAQQQHHLPLMDVCDRAQKTQGQPSDDDCMLLVRWAEGKEPLNVLQIRRMMMM